ncbi:hypothetical protein HDU98_000006 [Podochytrium sp. JEL0797]|nr:hypothetical protein HDU98_000006 [Podochytrium sp. JEL0797]
MTSSPQIDDPFSPTDSCLNFDTNSSTSLARRWGHRMAETHSIYSVEQDTLETGSDGSLATPELHKEALVTKRSSRGNLQLDGLCAELETFQVDADSQEISPVIPAPSHSTIRDPIDPQNHITKHELRRKASSSTPMKQITQADLDAMVAANATRRLTKFSMSSRGSKIYSTDSLMVDFSVAVSAEDASSNGSRNGSQDAGSRRGSLQMPNAIPDPFFAHSAGLVDIQPDKSLAEKKHKFGLKGLKKMSWLKNEK